MFRPQTGEVLRTTRPFLCESLAIQKIFVSLQSAARGGMAPGEVGEWLKPPVC